MTLFTNYNLEIENQRDTHNLQILDLSSGARLEDEKMLSTLVAQ